MNNICLKIAVAMIAGIGLFSSQAGAVTRDVNCDKGQTIQGALDKGQGSAEPLVINVNGWCEESVLLRRDDVTINGNNNATVSGRIRLEGSSRITIENIRVTGPEEGIDAHGSSIVALNNVTATGNQGWVAVNSSDSSSMWINNSIISNNDGIGIFVGLSSSLVTGSNTVVNDNEVGIQLSLHSSAFIQDGTSIQGNATGINANTHAIVDLENAVVSTNTYYGIYLTQDSAASLRTGNTISGNGTSGVFCTDTESSYSNQGAPIDDLVDCTGFNQVAP